MDTRNVKLNFQQLSKLENYLNDGVQLDLALFADFSKDFDQLLGSVVFKDECVLHRKSARQAGILIQKNTTLLKVMGKYIDRVPHFYI